MVAICSSVSDMSFLNFCTPTLRSMCQGGIWRDATRALIDRAHGRESLKVTSDIGAIEPGSWHDWHLAWKIGATSLENVTGFWGSAALAAPGAASRPAATIADNPRQPFIPAILNSLSIRVT